MQRILISGATGLIGKALTDALVNKGYTVNALVRKSQTDVKNIHYFTWNVEEGIIDKTCIEDVDAIVHLAGANISKKPWSRSVRTRVLKSRTDSIALIFSLLSSNHRVKTVISASGTGYYGARGEELLTEEKAPADDFLGQACLAWEQAVANGQSYGLRTVSLRCGMVLTKNGGALPILAGPIAMGLGAALGNGKQYTPWIHLEDVVNMYIFALEHPGLSGVYNMVAPQVVTNRQLNQEIAKKLGKPLWLPSVPAFLLRGVLGKMSAVVLDSTKVSAERILNAGFKFKHPTLPEALGAIYENSSVHVGTK